MFSRILTSALLAGAGAGLIAAFLQLWFLQPVLLHAELYEQGRLVHFGAASAVPAHLDLGGLDPLRDGLTLFFTLLIYAGYALLLVALMSLAEQRGVAITARSGLVWGLAGFAVLHLAPGFSLAPEVPGVAAAAVGPRQIWWFVTVFAAGGAAWLIAFGGSWRAWGAAVLLLLAPHVVGAPEPDHFAGTAPPELAALFAARSYGVAMAGWVLLGVLAGYFWSREAA
ncbi:MAG: CbtA family protein [Thalassobaculaceae bacterium]|nr:CbtA family protein [Thalassobaculaceae bacterium]